MKKKRFRKGIAVILCVMMTFMVLPFQALAESNHTENGESAGDSANAVNLLSIGDATANGSFLEGYTDAYQGIGANLSPESYPYRIVLDLAEQYGEDNVDFTNYCFNTMRWSSLRMILERSLEKTEDIPAADDFDQRIVSDMSDAFNQAVLSDPLYLGNPSSYEGKTGEEAFDSAFIDAVQNADIITIDLGMNDFTDCLQQLMVCFDNYQSDEIKTAALTDRKIEGIQDEIDSTFGQGTTDKIRQFVETTLSDLDTSAGESVIQMAVYACGNVLLNYEKSLSYIYEENPDVKVCICGMYNGIEGMKVITEEGSVNAGELWGQVISGVNGFLSGKDSALAVNPFSDRIYFSEAGAVHTLISEIVNFDTLFGGDPRVDYGNEGYRDEVVDHFIEAFFSLNGEDTTDDFNAALIGEKVEKRIIDDIKKEGSHMTENQTLNDLIVQKVEKGVPTLMQHLLEGIHKNCCQDGETLTAEDVKAAYAYNEMKNLDQDKMIDELGGYTNIIYILMTNDFDNKKVVSMLQDKDYDMFAVVLLFEMFRDNMEEAAVYTDLNIMESSTVLSTGGNLLESTLSALVGFNGETTAEGEKSTLALCVQGLSLRGFSTLPDLSGAQSKSDNMKKLEPFRPLLGDITLDRKVDILDARMAKRIAMKDETVDYDKISLKAGDFDSNGKVTINEARKIKRAVLEEVTL